ncbi:MAG TPA: MBL fold metallo-hydrolase [Pyrinomonadaceae bacterium]|jgi:glyoxylase-like metal-dependent hydrolase (beta-lactamase superfamily II)|nr:MBL fold metallo-hydrolase [Pyrinomonadaceae bacterium]
MRVREIAPDVYSLIGEAMASNSTIIANGDEVLMIDAMGSRSDAEELRRFVESELGKRVRFIICTHFFSDHLAALKLFPQSQIIAHRNYAHTFDSERFRTDEEMAHFVEPDILISDGIRMRWGKYELDVFHNPGHTMSTINIDIPGADLLMVGDNIVGNLVYLYYSSPDLAKEALERLHRRGRAHVIEGHGGLLGGETVGNALYYLDSLAKNVAAARLSAQNDDAILEIGMEECFKPGVEGTDFERKFHKRNLQTITERGLFAQAAGTNRPMGIN